MLGDQGVLVALFYKERPAGRRQVGARAEESGQMNARLRIHSLLSQHYQRRPTTIQRSGCPFLALILLTLCFSR